MSKAVFNQAIEKCTEEEVKKLISSFTSLGWTYDGDGAHVGSNQFIKFIWDKNADPIYPEGKQPSSRPIMFPNN